MKCFVLAGGSGDALWPLSRRNYPKQFININKGRSLFQEAIARNLPFCDEFFIVTNYKYENIVRGQLQVFQGLQYHLLLEELGRQTAPAVTIACLCVSAEEEILVISTDHMVGQGDYNQAVLKAREQLNERNIVTLGCHLNTGKNVTNDSTIGHNYFDVYQDGQVEYISTNRERTGVCDAGLGGSLPDSGVLRLLDSGIFLTYARTFLSAIGQNKPGLFEACQNGKNRMRMEGGAAVLTKEWLTTIPSVSVGEAVYEKWADAGRIKVVDCDFEWSRLLSLETVADILTAKSEQAGENVKSQFDKEDCCKSTGEKDIFHNCRDISVINTDSNKIIVANHLQDTIIVNTKDATYISRKGDSADIKQIVSQQYTAAFDEGDIFYTSWGVKETLNRSEGYLVKKLTIFPGQALSLHKHEKRSEHWSIVSGTATIFMNGKEREYARNESILVPMGVFHRISNETAKDLVVIEVSIGESAGTMQDLVKQGSETTDIQQLRKLDLVKLEPVLQDYLWGGERLHALYGMDNQGRTIAESWELSAHKAGVSRLAEGSFKGMTFDTYLAHIGKEALGWKCQPYERFPMMVKLIDANQQLSVQVHPGDSYALAMENDYGKNEMWYVLEAQENAFIYLGFEKDTNEEECRRRIADGTLTEILHKVPVKMGDSIFVRSGMVHAINEGVLILEVQQSSNATYRLYDYNRKDRQGNLRQLHLDKAFANIDFKASQAGGTPLGEWQHGKGFKKQLLEQCKYFSVLAYRVADTVELSMDDSTFYSIVFVSGKGSIQTESQAGGSVELSFMAGESFFLPAGKKVVRITGECHFVLSHV